MKEVLSVLICSFLALSSHCQTVFHADVVNKGEGELAGCRVRHMSMHTCII